MLNGSLATVSLPGLIQLLSLERRSGCLRIEAGGSPAGALWFERGRPIHAELGCAGSAEGEAGLAGEEAVYRLIGMETGSFSFEVGVTPLDRTMTTSVEHLLMEAACRKDHAGPGDGSPLPASAVPRFAPVADGGATPRFNTMQWRVLAAIDGRRSVAGLAAEIGLPMAAVASVLFELMGAGAVRVSSPG